MTCQKLCINFSFLSSMSGLSGSSLNPKVTYLPKSSEPVPLILLSIQVSTFHTSIFSLCSRVYPCFFIVLFTSLAIPILHNISSLRGFQCRSDMKFNSMTACKYRQNKYVRAENERSSASLTRARIKSILNFQPLYSLSQL